MNTTKYRAAFKILLDQSKSLLQVLLNHGVMTMLVGGAVRDCLLAHLHNTSISVNNLDLDLVVDVAPEKAMQILELNGFKIIETGLDFGSFTAIDRKGHIFEITSLRKDVECTGRKAQVILGGTLEEDSWRRDFSINALYLDINGDIYDFHNGIEDLHTNIVRFIGDARTRIKEDYLRILRFFRFSSRFATIFDHHAIAAIMDSHHGIAILSKERITKEIYGILTSDKATLTLQTMQDIGTLSAIFGLDFTLEFQHLTSMQQTIEKAIELKIDHTGIPLLALSFDSNHNPAILQKLTPYKGHKYLIQKSAQMLSMATCKDKNAILRSLLTKNRDTNLIALCFSDYIDLRELANMIYKTTIVPINGHDIVQHFPELQYQQIGQVLSMAYNIWIEHDFKVDKTFILDQVIRHIHSADINIYQE